MIYIGMGIIRWTASNKRGQWSAASEFRILPSVLRAAPTDADRWALGGEQKRWEKAWVLERGHIKN